MIAAIVILAILAFLIGFQQYHIRIAEENNENLY